MNTSFSHYRRNLFWKGWRLSEGGSDLTQDIEQALELCSNGTEYTSVLGFFSIQV